MKLAKYEFTAIDYEEIFDYPLISSLYIDEPKYAIYRGM